MYVSPKALLLDVDGVVFRNRAVLNKVSDKVVKYVSKELNIDATEARLVNKALYGTFGHTYIGMRSVYGTTKSIHHFSQHVYDDELIHDLTSSIADDTIVKDSKSVRCLAEECKRKDIDLYLFSNAPHVWCSHVLSVMHLSTYIPGENIITCDHEVFHKGLKPMNVVYDTMLRYIFHKTHDDVSIMFVDDTFMNHVPILCDPHWRPVYVNNVSDAKISTRRIQTIFGLDELYGKI